jgi:hypothetical protein
MLVEKKYTKKGIEATPRRELLYYHRTLCIGLFERLSFTPVFMLK